MDQVFLCTHSGRKRYFDQQDGLMKMYFAHNHEVSNHVLWSKTSPFIKKRVAKLCPETLVCGMEHIHFLNEIGMDLTHVTTLDMYMGFNVCAHDGRQVVLDPFTKLPMLNYEGYTLNPTNPKHFRLADHRTHLDTGDYFAWEKLFRDDRLLLEHVSFSYDGLPCISSMVWTFLMEGCLPFIQTLDLGRAQATFDGLLNPNTCLQSLSRCPLLPHGIAFPLRKEHNYAKLMCAYLCFEEMQCERRPAFPNISMGMWRQFSVVKPLLPIPSTASIFNQELYEPDGDYPGEGPPPHHLEVVYRAWGTHHCSLEDAVALLAIAEFNLAPQEVIEYIIVELCCRQWRQGLPCVRRTTRNLDEIAKEIFT